MAEEEPTLVKTETAFGMIPKKIKVSLLLAIIMITLVTSKAVLLSVLLYVNIITLFAYQFLIEARPKPDTFLLLSNAEWFYGAKSSAKAESLTLKG